MIGAGSATITSWWARCSRRAPDRYNIIFELYNVLTRQRLLGYQISANKRRIAAREPSSRGHGVREDPGRSRRVRHAHRLRLGAGHLPNRTYRLIVADADGENPHVVMQSNEPLMSPSWSPDGQSLAYVSFEDRLPSVYVQELKTGERRRVSAQAGVNQAPAWSPDGKKLALTLSTRDGNLDIYVLDLASQALTRITDDPGIDTEPQWSKDGQSLYFTSDRAGGPQIYRVGIQSRRQAAPPDLPGQLQCAAAPVAGRVAAGIRHSGGRRLSHCDHGSSRARRCASAHQGSFRRSRRAMRRTARKSSMRAAIADAACWRW